MFLVPRPEAVQTVIRFAWPAVARGDADRSALELANLGLGGSFTSRLNQNLREKNGYTYGAGSRVSAERTLGWMGASASVRADVTGASLKEFLSEINGIASGNLSQDELAKAVESTKNERVGATEGTGGLIAAAIGILARGETFDSFDAETARIEMLTLADLNAAAKKHIVPKQGILVLVGDEQLIREQTKGLNLGPIQVVADPAGSGH